MFRTVTIISLSLSVTVSAAPRGKPQSRSRSKCEALVTNSGLAAEAADLIRQVRETAASLELRQTLKSAPGSLIHFAATDAELSRYASLLAEMNVLATSIENALGNASAVAERDVLLLRNFANSQLPEIQSGIALVQENATQGPRTQNLMKRETLYFDQW